MSKAVFTTKVNPTYDDLPEQRYHFPRTYLGQVEQAVDDFILYYEPRRSSGNLSSRGGRQAYFAVARVERIESDILRPDHYYAIITDYLEFDRPVPFSEGEHYYESRLKRSDGRTNKGAFGRSVRVLPDGEFRQIFTAGFAEKLFQTEVSNQAPGLAEPPLEYERSIIQSLIARPFRDEVFKRQVRRAYDNRCALTGLRLINGGGRPEVQAAHIRPVAERGPDSIRNGLALYGTAHWMFDRGLVSIDDDLRILLAKDKIPDDALRLLSADGAVRVPVDETQRPHPKFLAFHREHVFKG